MPDMWKARRVNPDRIQKLLAVRDDDMHNMDGHSLRNFAKQCEVDFVRLTEAAAELMAASRLLADQQVEAQDVMIERRIKI